MLETNENHSKGDVATGGPAVVELFLLLRPETLRPYFSIGLPFMNCFTQNPRSLSTHLHPKCKVFFVFLPGLGKKSGSAVVRRMASDYCLVGLTKLITFTFGVSPSA